MGRNRFYCLRDFFSIFVKKKNLRYFIHLAYNGAAYHGWQYQQNARSVQSEVEKCMSLKIGESVKLTGCGRTDTGVHAKNYYAHFDLQKPIDSLVLGALVSEIDRFLPNDITLYHLWPVDDQANARFDAVSRTYQYHISRAKDPFNTAFSWYVYGDLNVEAMQEGSRLLLGKQDFTSFAKLHAQTKTNICTVLDSKWLVHEKNLVFEITADRFLRNMVRAIVGTLIELGRDKLTMMDMKEIIRKRDRSSAGFSAPAQGLFLQNVDYPERIKYATA